MKLNLTVINKRIFSFDQRQIDTATMASSMQALTVKLNTGPRDVDIEEMANRMNSVKPVRLTFQYTVDPDDHTLSPTAGMEQALEAQGRVGVLPALWLFTISGRSASVQTCAKLPALLLALSFTRA